jgi:signal transduction histidine kinase
LLHFINSDISSEERKEYIDIINNNSSHLIKLIDDILVVSKIEANQLTINPVPMQLNKLMNELSVFFTTYLQSIDKTHIEFILDSSGFIDQCVIQADPKRLRQILNNLIDNAIKFTEEGHIRFGYRQSAPDQLEFVVEDTGIGLSSNQHTVIFERFQQADVGYNRQYEGTGLGLTISRSLVQMMGGEIWVESPQNKGTTFYFTIKYLPVAPQEGFIFDE